MTSPLPEVLPKVFSLKSKTNNRYLRYIHQDFDGLNGLLQFSGEKVVSPYTKFHKVEAQGDSNTNLVNIQSCYNNKYLRRLDEEQVWIVAGDDEPQKNPADWSCTLFEPIIIEPLNNGVEIKLRHVESDTFLKISRINECLFLSPDNFDVFTVIDWNKFVILPKHLAFKGNLGSYISVKKDAKDSYLHFLDKVPTDKTVVENEVFPAPAGDGSVCIYSTYKQKFWRLNHDVGANNIDDWIWADEIDIVDIEARFWPVKVHHNVDDDVVVTLRNLGSNNICKRVDNYLNAGTRNVLPPREHLAVEELVTSRTISILNFHALTDARIYNRNKKVVTTKSAENRTQQLVSKTIWLSYEDTKASTWNTSTEDLAFTAIIPTTLTSDTPFLLDGGRIGVSGNFNGTYQWGEPHTSSTRIMFPVRVDVPPQRMVTVTLRATEASCDIPFNYSKKDTLIGQRTTYNEEVGLYTGVSLYNFQHEAKEGQLPPAGR